MKIADFTQGDEYSCTACVLRYVLHRRKLSIPPRHTAIRNLGCYPDGASLNRLRSVLKGYGIFTKSIKPHNAMYHLRKGRSLVIDDDITWEDPHVVYAYGYRNDNVRLFDSYLKKGVVRRSAKKVLANATEAFTILE